MAGKHDIVHNRFDSVDAVDQVLSTAPAIFAGTGGEKLWSPSGRYLSRSRQKHHDQALIEFTHRFPPLCY